MKKKYTAVKRSLAALVVLLVGLLTVSSASAADMNGALKFVPKNAFGVIGVNFDGLKKSPVFKPAVDIVLDQAGAKRELKKLKNETGIDVYRDLKGLIAVFTPEFIKDDDNFLLVAQLKFNQKRLVSFMNKTGAKLKKQSGPNGKFYLIGRRGKGAIAFRGKYVVVGAAPIVKRALAKPRGAKARLMQIDRNATRKDLFVLGHVPKKLKKELTREHKDLGALQNLGATLGVAGGGIKLNAVGKFSSALAASRLASLMNKGLAQGKKDRSMKKLGLAKYINAFKVGTARKKLIVKLRLSKKDLNDILATFNKVVSAKKRRRKSAGSAPPPPPMP